MLRVAEAAPGSAHLQHLDPAVVRRPPPTTRARAHCIGLEIDVARIKEQYPHALLLSASDFAIFSTHGLLQDASYFNLMRRHSHSHGLQPAQQGGVAPSASGSRQHAGGTEQLHPPPHHQHQHEHEQWAQPSAPYYSHEHTGHEEEDATRPMPLCECVVVYEFGAAVFFSSFAGEAAGPHLHSPHLGPGAEGNQGGHAGGPGAAGAGLGVGVGVVSPPPAGPVLERQQQEELEQLCLDLLKPFVLKEPPEGTKLPHPEEVRLAVSPGIHKELQKSGELLQLKRWDQGGVEAVSRIMGQSIALDLHTDITDEKLYQLEQLMQQLVHEYRAPRHRRLLARILALPPWLWVRRPPGASSASSSASSSSASSSSSSSAYVNQEAQLVESSALTIMVINRLGILDKDHTPWESDQHDELWQRLRSFFTIDKRLSHLLRKLEQLEQKTDHLLSLKTDERTMGVEFLICGLIFTEIVINIRLGAHGPGLPPSPPL